MDGSALAALSIGALSALADALRGFDPTAGDAERIDRIRALEELKSAAAAAQARETAAFVASQREQQRAAGMPTDRVGRGIAAQVGLALRVSPFHARRYVGWAGILTSELPETFAELQAGRTSEWRAMIVARETAWLSRRHRAAVDRELAPQLAKLGDRKVESEAKRLAYRLDPHGYVDRLRAVRDDRRVTLRPAPDMMCRLIGLLPVDQGVAAHAALVRDADALRAAGDPRGRGQVMADLMVERLTGQARASDVPMEVNLVMTDQALLAGGGEPATLIGFGPLPAPLAREFVLRARRTSAALAAPAGPPPGYRRTDRHGVAAAVLHARSATVRHRPRPNLPYSVLRCAGSARRPCNAGGGRRQDGGPQRARAVRGLQLRAAGTSVARPGRTGRRSSAHNAHRTPVPQSRAGIPWRASAR